MGKIQIIASCKSGASLAKFRINPAPKINVNKSFSNIDQASDAPLVKQLFYLPFVKKVFIENNIIIIERFDILEWEEVITEVATQIEDYLNQGGVIINEPKNIKKSPITIYAESTPNPSTMKFVANKKLVNQSISFKHIDEAIDAPLVKELFNFPFVKEIFLDENYISISKYDETVWDDIVMELRDFIKSYLEQEKAILGISFSGNNIENNPKNFSKNLNETEQEIVNILEEYVKPAVASDGGNIIFDSYEDKEKLVKVLLQGACSGCPSSTLTLKNGIENILKEMLPGKVNLVEAVNG
ncbi:MAG: NifU N-terminal domain-containing protein [Bacteroidota bacterium]|nr:NifU N-terminal domain-containing protein [Bacteroidota bacterium]